MLCGAGPSPIQTIQSEALHDHPDPMNPTWCCPTRSSTVVGHAANTAGRPGQGNRQGADTAPTFTSRVCFTESCSAAPTPTRGYARLTARKALELPRRQGPWSRQPTCPEVIRRIHRPGRRRDGELRFLWKEHHRPARRLSTRGHVVAAVAATDPSVAEQGSLT